MDFIIMRRLRLHKVRFIAEGVRRSPGAVRRMLHNLGIKVYG